MLKIYIAETSNFIVKQQRLIKLPLTVNNVSSKILEAHVLNQYTHTQDKE